MRTIRNRKNISKKVIRKINNLFDSAMYNAMWGDVVVQEAQDKSFDIADYIRFHKLLGIMHKMSFDLRHTTYRMSVNVLPFSLMRKPEAMEYKGKVYYGVVFNGWESECYFGDIDKGDTIYMRMSINKETAEFTYDILHCEGCGRPITEGKYIVTEDTHHIYCHDCEGDYYYECDSCGEYFDDEYYEAENDSSMHICHHCFEWTSDEPDGWYRCNECGDVFYDCGTWAHDRYGDEVVVCESCQEDYYRYCEDCEEYHHRDDMRYVNSRGGYVCDECIEDHYVQCRECDEYFHEDSDEIWYDERDGYYYCDNCRDNRGCVNHCTYRVIRKYHEDRGENVRDEVGNYDMPFLVSETRQINHYWHGTRSRRRWQER